MRAPTLRLDATLSRCAHPPIYDIRGFCSIDVEIECHYKQPAHHQGPFVILAS